MKRFALKIGGGSVAGVGAALLGYDFAKQHECDDSGSRPVKKGAEVLVIGGGIAGVSSAYFLSRAGFRVTIVEKGPHLSPEYAATSLNAGWLRAASTRPATNFANLKAAAISAVSPEGSKAISMDPLQFLPLRNTEWTLFGLRYTVASLFESVQKPACKAFSEISSFSREMTLRASDDEGWDRSDWSFKAGSLAQFCFSTEEYAQSKRAANAAINNGFKVDCLDQAEARAACEGTGFQSKLVGIMHEHDGFSGDSKRFVDKMAHCCAEKFNCKILINTSITALHADNGRITTVECSDGKVFTPDAVVLANGAWAPVLARTVNVWLPIVPVRGYSLDVPATTPHSKTLEEHFQRFPNCFFPDCKLAITGYGDAVDAPRRVRFTSVAEFLPVDAPARPAMVQYLKKHAVALYPELEDAIHASQVHLGSRPQTPDDIPIVSGTRYTNLFINAGACSYGWRFGCGMSAMLATLMSGHHPDGLGNLDRAPDVKQFSLSRFQWGSFLNRA